MRVLFLCGKNRKRSPTAEVVFAGEDGVVTDSAGVSDDAEVVVTAEQVDQADLIVVMEPRHRRALQRRWGRLLRDKRVVCVDVKDDYEFMDAALVDLLRARMLPLLR